MARKPTPIKPLDPAWEIATEISITNYVGKTMELTPGITLGVKGEQGRFSFIKHVKNTRNGAIWIDCLGGIARGTNGAVVMFRSFRPDRVSKVYPDVKRKKGKGE